MASKPSPPAESLLSKPALRRMGRLFFSTTGLVIVVAAGVLAVLPRALSADLRVVLVATLLAFAAFCALAWRLGASERFPMNPALLAVSLGAMLLAGAVSVLLGDGLHGATLGFGALLVCALCAISGWPYGMALTLFGSVEWLLIALAEPGGGAPASWLLPLLFQWLVLFSSLLAGGLIAKVLRQHLREAGEREQRFHSLLRIAADWYWEQDRRFRFTMVSKVGDKEPGFQMDERLGRTVWQVPGMGLSEAQVDAHRADLEARLPFTGLMTRSRDLHGRTRIHSLSGEPKFDAGGVFVGYWGVGRDVTDEVRARRAMAASETRYRELFTRSPSPLMLHRRGKLFDANDAAARLFGFEQAGAMQGFQLAELFPAGDPRDKALVRIATLEALALGESIPVTDYQTRALDGRPISVQATGVRVDTLSGPATLSILFDISARQSVEAALRRSEGMLSHLFANSPDCITLMEMDTGRYAMVNESFTRLLGYTPDEVIGRSDREFGLWQEHGEREELVARVRGSDAPVEMLTVVTAKSGARVSMRMMAARFTMDGCDYLVVNGLDVTDAERTRLEHAAILARASIGIAFTRDQRFVQANPCFEQMFGWAPGALIGQPGSVVWASVDDYADIGLSAGLLLSEGKPFEAERELQRRDGSRFWCRLLAQVIDHGHPSQGGTIWIAEDVTERRRLDQALAAARDAAEAASRAKSAFLANTSHEIRTPLNGLLGLARLAMQPELDPRRRQQYLSQIFDSAQSLSEIISDILDVSKIEAGKITLEDLPFALRDTLHAVHHAYGSLAEVKGLALTLVVDEALPITVQGDPMRLRQILSNFITNALKFTERGRVDVQATRTESGHLRLAVSDTGPGMDAATQARLFMPFSQGDTSTTRRYGGTGLGLSISRELARLMGGEVGVHSEVGAGSTFWAELPLRPASVAHAAAPPHDDAGDLIRLRGMQVLLVEDNPVNMLIAVAILEQWGVQVTQAFDGGMAIDAVERASLAGRPFDAVLMDVQMPGMSGHEAARALRQHHDAEALPIIALTAAALVSERDEAFAAGMNNFLTKPIDATKLKRVLASVARRSGSQSD